YYQIWLQPLKSDGKLIVIYALHVPLDFPLGDELDQPVSTTGFFFKRWAYPSRSGILTAPLVLARSLEWKPAPPAAPAASSEEQVLLAAAASLVLAAGVVVWVWLRSRRPRAAASLAEPVQLDARALA